MKVLDRGKKIEELRVLEQFWILVLGTQTIHGGVNATSGGEGVLGLVMPPSAIEKFKARTAKQMSVKHPRSLVSIEQVIEIKKHLWNGIPPSLLVLQYPLTVSSIQKISEGKNWSEVPWPIGPRRRIRDRELRSLRAVEGFGNSWLPVTAIAVNWTNGDLSRK